MALSKDAALGAALVCCSLLFGCGGATSDTADDDVSVQLSQLPTDETIIAMVYDPDYRVPGHFFVDERADTPRSYAVYHVKDPSVSFELCTDDYYEALAWEEADNARRSVSGYFVGHVENDRYFEFVRELAYDDEVGNIPDLSSPGFARIFKCSNVDRDGVDRNLRNGYAGTLNSRPVSPDAVRTLTEYLWQFAFFTAARTKVLDSYTDETMAAFEHTLVLGLATNQGSGRCDRVDVAQWVFSANKLTGEVHKRFQTLRSLEARMVGGVAERC